MIELTELDLTPIHGGRKWKLIKDWEILVKGHKLIIPKGFITDFATVPRWLWLIFPPATGKYRKATIVHDWMYVTAYKTKQIADKLFLYILESSKVRFTKRYLMYYAVKLFGRGNYES